MKLKNVIIITMIFKIDNLDIEELNIYNKLSERELLHYNEPREGIFIAESPKVILRALDAGYEPISVLISSDELSAQDNNNEVSTILNRCKDIPIYCGNEALLLNLTGFKLTRGMLCAMKRLPTPDAKSLCDKARRIAVLENVVNPTNLGAIIRSAAALKIEAILLTKDCVDPLYRRCVRVSMGTVFQIPWTFIPSDDPVAYLKNIGFKTAAMALTDNCCDISNPILKEEKHLAIILGNEGLGLPARTINSADYVVKIPMTDGVDSLNVAAASAVAFWELCKVTD